MRMKKILEKLVSRKFLVSAVSMIAGVAALCGADLDTVRVLAGTAMTVLPALIYCISEGRVDAATVDMLTRAVQEMIRILPQYGTSEGEKSDSSALPAPSPAQNPSDGSSDDGQNL